MLKISVSGIPQVKKKLEKIPSGVKAFMYAVSIYLIGNDRHGLKHEEPYKFVSRARAYGRPAPDGAPAGYFSWRQFRYVAALTKGFTDFKSYRPTKSSPQWTAVPTSRGYGYSLRNPTEAEYWKRSDKGQARQLALVGWRKAMIVIQSNMRGALAAGKRAWLAYINNK